MNLTAKDSAIAAAACRVAAEVYRQDARAVRAGAGYNTGTEAGAAQDRLSAQFERQARDADGLGGRIEEQS